MILTLLIQEAYLDYVIIFWKELFDTLFSHCVCPQDCRHPISVVSFSYQP